MSALEKASLLEIKIDDSGNVTPVDGAHPIPVQFNPNTLKLQLTNVIEGNQTIGKPVRQYIGSSSTTLSLDLIFDTADEGTAEKPRSVREKTALVEKFVRPKGERQTKQVVPQLRFLWGDLVIYGILESITVDFDHFAANGTPLRAKVGLAIKEQNSKFQYLPADPAPGSPGSTGGGLGDRSAPALGGESAAEFAARVGLDPAAWRGLAIGLSNPLTLEAGVEIGFSADLRATAGFGVTVGVEAGVSASLEAAFGLEASASVSVVAGVGVSAGLAAGFALTASGGVSTAISTVQNVKHHTAVQEERQAFGAPSPGALPGPTVQKQPHPSLSRTGLPSASAQQAAAPAPATPRTDPRSSSFGFGVPLRPIVGAAANLRTSTTQGGIVLRPQVVSSAPPATDNPTTPAWVSLPGRDPSRVAADQIQRQRRPSYPCHCSGSCRHRGGH